MNGLTLALLTLAGVPAEQRQRVAGGFLTAAGRYAMSAFGPIGISAAHFIAALIFLHTFSRTEFGLFSFLLVVVPFCLSVSGAMFAPPIAREVARPNGIASSHRLTLFKTSIVFSVLAGVVVGALTGFGGTPAAVAATFGLYGGLMSLRWFARCWTYAERRVPRVLASDLAYSGLLIVALSVLALSHRMSVWNAALALLGSAAAGMMAFDGEHLLGYAQAIRAGRLRSYFAFWRDLSRWALLGVVMSEATVNAHAYLVTFISGPHAFAVLAIGTLLMRPVSLVLSALPDVERPLMSRALHAGEGQQAFRIVKEFRTAAGAIWLATLALAVALLTWFPQLLLKKTYPLGEVVAVLVISAAIMALRTLRTPDSVLLQAAGEFRKLTGPGLWSSLVAMTATFALLLIFGPVAALGGILVGEIVATERTFALTRAWKASRD
jgi:O-antigen/teichoic acid export membrane protein